MGEGEKGVADAELAMSFRPRPRGGLPSERYEDETIIVEPESSTMHALTGVGPFLWSRMDGETSLTELSEALCVQFEVEPETARADVLAFVRELADLGLIEPT